MRFKDKVVVITGAAAGIGKGAALLFAAEGAKLMLADINEIEGKELAEEIRNNGGHAHFVKTDVSKKKDVNELMTACIDHFGKIDIGVNNAGVGGAFGPIETMTEEDYESVISVNQTGVFFCMQEEIKQMKKQGGGVIVNTASMAGLIGSANASIYVASKHAVVGLTKSAALENAKHNIRVNAVCPAFVLTNMVEELLNVDDSFREKLKGIMPMNRYGTTKEIAEAIAFLSSDQSSFNTGLCLPVDGGLVA